MYTKILFSIHNTKNKLKIFDIKNTKQTNLLRHFAKK